MKLEKPFPLKFFLLLVILLFAFPVITNAGCAKEDVEFYLEKGFTQEQITELCSAAGAASSVPDYQPYQQKVIIYSDEAAPGIKDGFTREEREAIKALEAGGDVVGLKVDQENISYTRKVCIRAGMSKNEHERYETCPNAKFVVSRRDLKADSSGKKLIIFGSNVVYIEGDIKSGLEGSWKDFPQEFQRALERDYHHKENGKESVFPVRGDFSITRTVNALRALSIDSSDAVTDDLAENRQKSDDETVSQFEPSEKKKKKWWNPFD